MVSQTNTTPAPTGVIYPQDYNLKTLAILTVSGVIDLKPVMVELSYYEDIFSNTVSGKLVINDAQGFIEKLHLSGSEYLQLIFSKASDKYMAIKLTFRVYKISARQLLENMTSEGYIIHFCSDELFMSQQYQVSKSYPNWVISDIVKDILLNSVNIPEQNYAKKVSIEPTRGSYSFIVPNMHPFEAINWLSSYALSASPGNVGADMLFFENKNGFNFSSLQTLFSRGVYRDYTYQPKNIDIDPLQKFYGVLQVVFSNTFDTLGGIASGTFANRLIGVDPLLQRYQVRDFDYSQYFVKAETLNKHPVIDGSVNRRNDTMYQTPLAKLKLTPSNSGQEHVSYISDPSGSITKDMRVEEFIPNRTAQIGLANYNKIKLVVNGDPGAVVGATIKFNYPSMSPSADKGLDNDVSGKYLILGVKHTITLGGYTTTLEIITDSLISSPITPNTSDPTRKSVVAGLA